MDKYLEEQSDPWQTLNIERSLVTEWFVLRQDRVLTHSGLEITYTFLEHPGSVVVVPVTPHGEILLLRQYRYTVDDWCWEVPAGRVEASDEDSSLTARRELKEETGGICQELSYIGAFYTSSAVSNERCEVYLARGVERRESNPEQSELLRVVAIPYREVLRMARAGEIKDGPSALALLLCEPYLNVHLE